MSPAFYAAAMIHGLRGDDDAYATWWELGSSVQLVPCASSCRIFFGCRVALHVGAIEQARLLATTSVDMHSFYDPYAHGIRAEIAVVTGSPDAEEQLINARQLTEQNDFVTAQLLRASGRLHQDETALKEAVVRWEAIGARFERACTLLLLGGRADEGVAELAALGCPVAAPV
jgi:hypothetical protein